jgi:putative aldouronate transport system substrate-binding protein
VKHKGGRNMKSKRLVGLVLSVLLVATVFAGCKRNNVPQGPGAGTGNSPAGDPITLTMFNGFTDAVQFPANNDLYKWVEEQTGIKLDVEYIVGDLPTKIGVMTASEDYHDLIWGHEHHQRFIEADAALAMNDWIDKYGDNVREVYGANLRRLTNNDGNIYFLAPYREGRLNTRVNRGWYVQRRVLRDAGWPTPKNLDEYFSLLTNFKDANPTTDGNSTIAFSVVTDSWRWFTLTNAASDLDGFTNDGITQITPGTFEANDYAISDSAYNYYKKLNELWNGGYMDPETFTMNFDTYAAKITQGRVLGFYDQWWQFNDAQTSLQAQGKEDYRYVAFPITWNENVVGRYHTPSVPIVRDGISISINNKAPERSFKFINWLLGEDVQKRITWGEEGREYLVDENGRFHRTEEMRESLRDLEYRRPRGHGALGYPWPTHSNLEQFSDGNWWHPEVDPVEIQQGYTENDLEVLEAYGVETFGEMFPQDPGNPWGEGWDIPVPDDHPIKDVTAKGDELSRHYLPLAIMARSGQFDTIWNQYVEEYNRLDWEAVRNFYHEAVKKRVADWN